MVSFRMRWVALAVTAIGVLGMTSPGSAAESSMIVADGSSTVYPITEAVAEEFQ
jgi:ABC-type phosphate transport system substrate-binding protein